MNIDRRLLGSSGIDLIDDVAHRVALRERRKRASKAQDADTRTTTISMFLANIVAASLNRVNPSRFVAISFDRNSYTGTGLSHKMMGLVRDTLSECGWLEGTSGHHRSDYLGHTSIGYVTRLRGTELFRAAFTDFGIGFRSIRQPSRDLVRINAADPSVGPEPASVTRTRPILAELNLRLNQASFLMSDEDWRLLVSGRTGTSTDAERQDKQYHGDLSAVTLFRVFTRTWERGGRLYGGWWQSVPKTLRPRILIDGQLTVELDYVCMHPSILFSRTGGSLDFDPYLTQGHDRSLGKDVFNRLLNGKRGASNTLALRAKSGYPVKGEHFQTYLRKMISSLSPIAHWFGVDEGAKLQKQDSELTLDIIGILNGLGVTPLPIHDSFIVKRADEAILREVMHKCFLDRFKVAPTIRVS